MSAPTIVSVAYPQPTAPFTPRSVTDIADFVVHHTAGPITQTPLEIDDYERNNADHDIYMPYTWLIGADGTIYAGRPPLVVSAATYGRNLQSVACCLIGDFQSDDAGFTGPPPQCSIDSLTSLCIWAHQQFPAISQTYAHGEVAALFYGGNSNYATDCCGDVLRALLPGIKSTVAVALMHSGG